MASIFISYSSLDKEVARQLASDLTHYGHDVWLDEWRIKVGQCIPTEIEKGIEEADFVILLLSSHAVQSNWVDREWKTAYWDEVNKKPIELLPGLLEKCEIPKLIQTKKYANFSKSYAIGFHELITAIDWYSESRGLTTSYEKSALQLPRIIRGSRELTVLTCRQLQARANRMIGKPIAIKNARVFIIFGPRGPYVNFSLHDATASYLNCYVEQDSALEDVILEQPEGHFYGVIRDEPRDAFVVSEWESAKPARA
jgi:hypothetical protein